MVKKRAVSWEIRAKPTNSRADLLNESLNPPFFSLEIWGFNLSPHLFHFLTFPAPFIWMLLLYDRFLSWCWHYTSGGVFNSFPVNESSFDVTLEMNRSSREVLTSVCTSNNICRQDKQQHSPTNSNNLILHHQWGFCVCFFSSRSYHCGTVSYQVLHD